MRAALQGSLRRLRTDYVDLFWLHVWDGVTPAAEVLATMAGLVAAGTVRYWGVSNAPAWWVATLVALAGARGGARCGLGPIGLQYFYSLVNREVESEHVPLARAAGLPREAAGAGDLRPAGDRRLDGSNPFGDWLFTERNWAIVDALRRVAAQAGESAARVALAWVMGRPGVASTLMGVSRVEQVADSIAALEVVLAPEHRAALDAASAPAPRMLDSLVTPEMRRGAVFGGAVVDAWSASAGVW